MNRLSNTLLVMAISMLCGFSALMAIAEEPATSKAQTRELIYCADRMTHEEREAYRQRMRATASPQERAELRREHREQMRDRARKSGMDPEVCRPGRYRQRQGGGRYENAE